MHLSVIIPTLDRGEVLLSTLEQLAKQSRPADEIIVVDQTEMHPDPVVDRLAGLHADGAIRWMRRGLASIPGAMNAGTAEASGELLLFLDDDVTLHQDLIAMHIQRHRVEEVAIVAGRVLQPWHDAEAVRIASRQPAARACPDDFAFHAQVDCKAARFSGGNVSMRRSWVLAVGGFDENFIGAAYRFEADFAARLLCAGGRIVFEPSALVHHLHCARGGTRSHGDHLRTAGPWHSTGRWYYLMRHPRTPGVLTITLAEARRSVLARDHLRAPWRVVPSLVAELSGIVCAATSALRGPRLAFKSAPAR